MITRPDRLLEENNPQYGYPYWWDGPNKAIQLFVIGVDLARGGKDFTTVWRYDSETKQYVIWKGQH